MDLSVNRQTTRTLETDKALELLQAMEARHEDQVRASVEIITCTSNHDG